MSSPLGSPPALPTSRSSPSSFSTSDESLELSFDYEIDSDGKLIRVSKGSSKSPHSAPPTPPQTSELPSTSPPSNAPGRRSSLSRSESMPEAGSSMAPTTDSLLAPLRQLSRTSSGPVSMTTPGQPSRVLGAAPLSGGLHGTGRRLGGPQRIRREEAERQRREIEERIRREEEEAERERERERARRAQEEKENERIETRQSPPQPHSSRPIAALPARQNHFGFSRATRTLAPAKRLPPVINEHEASERREDERAGGQDNRQQYQRRSVLETNGEPHPYLPSSRPVPSHHAPLSSRSANVYTSYGARRVTHEERMWQEQEIAEEEAYEVAEYQPERSPSPPYVPVQSGLSRSRSRHGLHQRRDSDTLRSGVPFPQYARHDDVEAEQHPRLSPSSRSLGGTTAVQANTARTSRSPTAVERPKSVAGEYADHNGRSSRRLQQQQQQQQQQAQQQLQQQQQFNAANGRTFVVNRKSYTRLDQIGKGGSSRVYRVMDSQNQIFAIKKVALDKTDEETLAGYMNEISLLRRLEGNRRVIRIIDNELRGIGHGKGHLLVVMECGEIDLAKLLSEQQKEPLNMIWVAYYWQQMLEAVQVIHDEKIVHSDLKPANFVLVKGQLKLIDFGIAKAIANDTTNIQRDHQIGTVNYMSPETIDLPEGMRRFKVGRPSDVWSLGCILYQMVYGGPPFHSLAMVHKMKAIPDKNHMIEFPEVTVPSVPRINAMDAKEVDGPSKPLMHLARPVRKDVIRTMQRCLVREVKERATIPELLSDEWLSMEEQPPPKPELGEDETIINTLFMQQLLVHAVNNALAGRLLTEEEQNKEAKSLIEQLQAIAAGSPEEDEEVVAEVAEEEIYEEEYEDY
ncbi:MPS1 [Sanghuangporus sanghuang]